MENEISKGKALFFLAITWLICFLLGSLFSFSFEMEKWNFVSKIVFWGPSLLLTIWTVTDYFITPRK